MKTLVLPVTGKAMETLLRFGATPVPDRPGYASVPMGAVDLMFLPLTHAVTAAFSEPPAK